MARNNMVVDQSSYESGKLKKDLDEAVGLLI